jgi:formate hydrogenlyase subunit 6/NADH:ubiquinone oxidoreductase subunit I
MICPVSAITMTKIWDTAVTNRLSMDTMNAREIKRKVREKVRKKTNDETVLKETEAEVAKEELESKQLSGQDLVES